MTETSAQERARAIVNARRNLPKPTIAELEELLSRSDEQVEILPDGSVTTASSKDELVDAIAAALTEAKRQGAEEMRERAARLVEMAADPNGDDVVGEDAAVAFNERERQAMSRRIEAREAVVVAAIRALSPDGGD